MLKNLFRTLKNNIFNSKPAKKEWHREGIGGLWDEMGKLQIDFLVKNGLKPEHHFLDIGCGSLRGGVNFIDYLNTDHYYGIDKEASLIDAGKEIELKRYGLEEKKPNLFLVDNFDLTTVPGDIQFDYMLAQSVFSHLMPDLINICFKNVMPRLKQDGTFYATFFESEDGKFDEGRVHPWRKNEHGTVKYPFSFFQETVDKLNLKVDYIGNWNHPKNQKILAFRR